MNKENIRIQNPEKLGEKSIVKGTKIWSIQYEGRDLTIGVNNYLWSIYSYPIGKWEGYLQINTPIYSSYEEERDINGIPQKISQTKALKPIPYIGMMGDKVIDIWIKREGEWKYLIRPVWILNDIHNIRHILTSFFN